MDTTTTAPKLTKAQRAAMDRLAANGHLSLRDTRANVLANLRDKGLVKSLTGATGLDHLFVAAGEA